jgi:hypothetical protein
VNALPFPFVRRLLVLGAGLGLAPFLSSRALAQGCMPIRFVSPVLGARGDVYLSRNTWQIGLAFRRLASDQFVLSREVRNDLGPGGQAPILESNSVTLTASYAVTDRLSVELNVPFMTGSATRKYADQQEHTTNATGFGDVNLIASYWLWDTGLRPKGNVAVGLGLKAPTGSHSVEDDFWTRTGDVRRFPVDQSIQLGDGGWGIIVQLQGFQPILDRSYLYGAASYTANPRRMTEVLREPGSSIHWGVPDLFHARAGVAWTVLPERGLSVSLGGRLDGTTRRDLIGGRDEGFRRPAIVGYLDPGIALTRGSQTISLNVPVRVYKRFRPSYLDPAVTGKPGGGGLAQSLIFASFTHRF